MRGESLFDYLVPPLMLRVLSRLRAIPLCMSTRLDLLLQKVTTPERLPVDVRGGVHPNLIKQGQLTFVMRAPHKPYVSLVGDFNQWDTRANPLQTDGAGTWWTTLPHPGWTRYGYYVIVDEDSHAWVGDPYAAKVDWTAWNPWGVLQTGAPQFEWSDRHWRTPALRDLVIYEMCVRDAAGRWRDTRAEMGNFPRLLNLLPHLVQTGVNAVELMPIQAFPGDSSWGYNPVFYHAIANSYGSPQDFKAFVDACHRRGIAVILDVAFNHAWSEHPYYHIYPPLWGPNGEQWADWNPFFHHTPTAIKAWGGVDWDHFEPDTTRYFQDVVRYWLKEYHVDGFRFDWVGGVDYDHRNPQDPDFNPYHGIHAIAWAAKQAKPDCILIAEYWTLDGTNPDKTEQKLVHQTPIDAVWNGYFHHNLEDVLNHRWQWEKKDIYRAIGGFRDLGYHTATQVINYTCSHDEVRPEHEIKFYSTAHIERPKGWTVQKTALALARCGLVALFGAPGVPMIYAGQEFGDDSPRTIDFVPLQWHKLKRGENATHYACLRRLIHARRSHGALRSDHIEFLGHEFGGSGIVSFRRWDETGDMAVAAINFSSRVRRVELPLSSDVRWRDVVHNRYRSIEHGRLVLNWPHTMLCSLFRRERHECREAILFADRIKRFGIEGEGR
ncbi:MAG: hypothetical protein IPK16_16555 [Anaerolineales bacterium]|nr:hypothetical protein [Anaerolineales bacterium]